MAMSMMSRAFKILIFFAALAYVFCDDENADSTNDNQASSGNDEHADGEVDEQGGSGGAADEDKFALTDDHLRQAHKDLDTNGDTKVSHQEFLTFAQKHHRDVELKYIDVDHQMKELDKSGDGRVSMEEWIEWSLPTRTRVNDDITKETIARNEELFKAADKDGDRFISKEEVSGLLAPHLHDHTLGSVVKHSLKDADSNNDGKIGLEEFSEHFLPPEAQEVDDPNIDDGGGSEGEGDNTKEQTKEMFQRVDTNGDGFLDAEELRPVVQGSLDNEVTVRNFVKLADRDGDKHIDAEELVSSRPHISDSDIQDHLIAWAKHRRIVV